MDMELKDVLKEMIVRPIFCVQRTIREREALLLLVPKLTRRKCENAGGQENLPGNEGAPRRIEEFESQEHC